LRLRRAPKKTALFGPVRIALLANVSVKLSKLTFERDPLMMEKFLPFLGKGVRNATCCRHDS
jgi:hypothetical protein